MTSGPLTAPAGGNGVYAYGSTSLFPTRAFRRRTSGSTWCSHRRRRTPRRRLPPTRANATEKGGIPNGSGGSPATGNVLTNDTDPDAGDTKTVTAVTLRGGQGTVGTALAGAYGSLVLNAAGPSPTPSTRPMPPCRACGNRANTLTDVFSYTMRDTAGATASTTLTVSIHGANDAPMLAVQTGSQNAVVGSAFSLVLPAGTFTDVDAGDTLTYSATQGDGSPLPSLAGLQRRDPHLQRHADGCVGTSASRFRPPISAACRQRDLQHRRDDDAQRLADGCRRHGRRHREGRHLANGSGGSPASGNVLTNDTDPDAGDTKTVTAVSFGAGKGTLGTALAGAHGSLVLNAARDLHLHRHETDAAAVQALRQSSDSLTDVFSYTMRDTAGATSTTTLTVNIHGANDAPTLAVQTGEPERARRLGLLSGAARLAPSPTSMPATRSPIRRPPPTARRFPPG